MAFPLRFSRSSVVALFALAWFGGLQEARADEACGDGSCPKGFRCETVTATACPDIDCAEGDECPVCEPTTARVCAPVECTSDADCATGMTCATEERTRCDGGEPTDCGDAREGEKPDCAPAAERNCTTERIRQCVPRWQLPCTTASDCGAGFLCEERESCGCSGSPGSGGGSDPGTPTPGEAERAAPAPADCSCEPSGEFGCVMIETACSSDANCPAGWTCEKNGNGACWSGPEGEGCEPADPANLCAPPYAALGGERGVDLDDGENTGSGSGAPESPIAMGSEGDDDPKVVTTDRGCTMATTPRSTGVGAICVGLGVLGVLVSRRRRRASCPRGVLEPACGRASS